jgi:2-keto-3-deoxy-L-fuconate dehydrogenase
MWNQCGSLVHRLVRPMCCSIVGYVHFGSLLEYGEGGWQTSFYVNLSMMLRLTRAVHPSVIVRQQRSIITVSRVQPSIRGFKHGFAYSVTKAGVIGPTKSAPVDFRDGSVRCVAMYPSVGASPSVPQRIASMPDPDAAYTLLCGRQPTDGMGYAGDIASLAVYLASDEPAFVSSSTMTIDGGAAN